MSDLTITNVSNDLQQRLTRRAARKGRTAQAEAREILREAVKDEPKAVNGSKREPPKNLYEAIRKRFAKVGYIDWPLPPRHPPPEPPSLDKPEPTA